jgi:hypothetical protein
MIVFNSNYNVLSIAINIGFRFHKHIKLTFAFWSVDFVYDGGEDA